MQNNLTLTSVVFELLYLHGNVVYLFNLTLTSVVFEFRYYFYRHLVDKFNFNKCCI